ncbi:MAG: hypothetical protein ABGX72_08500 [Methyloprofundus sp.]
MILADISNIKQQDKVSSLLPESVVLLFEKDQTIDELTRAIAASYGERTRGLVVPRRRRAVVLSESER